MTVRLLAAFALISGMASGVASGQTVCPPTPIFSPCELVFDIPSAPTTKPLDLQAEFRSPHASTFRAHAFWDGGSKWVIRYLPAEPGKHAYRLIGNGADFSGKQGELTVTPDPAL